MLAVRPRRHRRRQQKEEVGGQKHGQMQTVGVVPLPRRRRRQAVPLRPRRRPRDLRHLRVVAHQRRRDLPLPQDRHRQWVVADRRQHLPCHRRVVADPLLHLDHLPRPAEQGLHPHRPCLRRCRAVVHQRHQRHQRCREHLQDRRDRQRPQVEAEDRLLRTTLRTRNISK